MHPQNSITGPERQEASAARTLGNVRITAETLSPSQARYVRRLARASVVDHTALQSIPRVTVLPGGMVAKQFRGDNGNMPPGGPRGVVCGFSKASARRFRLKLAQIDMRACELTFGTLTWHNFWGDDWQDWKRARRRFTARLQYHFPGLLGFIWRLEFQARGAPHFHLLLCWKIGQRPQENWFTTWAAAAWNACIEAQGDRDHLKHGAKFINVQEGKGGVGAILGYMAKEMGKTDQSFLRDEDGEPLQTGRTWGVCGDIPMGPEMTIELTQEEWTLFCSRVASFGVGKGWYLGSINDAWPGFFLLGSFEQLGHLLSGIGGTSC